MITKIGRSVLWAMIALAVIFAVLALTVSPWWWLGELIFVPLALVGLHDITQKKHSITRNYPIIGHLRFILEDMGPELHQYLVENNTDGAPFNRDSARSSTSGPRACPTPSRSAPSTTSTASATRGSSTRSPRARSRRIRRATCASRSAEPTARSRTRSRVLNISAMSFGALGGNAVLAINTGAKMRQLRARHRRGRDLALPPRARRRPDLADRHRLLRLPQQGRRLRSRAVRRRTPSIRRSR